MYADYEVHLQYSRDYYQNRIKKRHAMVRSLILDAKDKPCADCGKQQKPRYMHFDHVRGPKKFNIADSPWKNYSTETIEQEIAKCDVVCAECHHRRSLERGEYIQFQYRDLDVAHSQPSR